MDETAKEFLDYLLYIGFVSKDCLENFLNCLNSNVNSSEKIKEILSNTFYYYLKSLNDDYQKRLSSKIVNNYFINKYKVNRKKFENLIKIYENFHSKKYKVYFFLWFKKTFSYNTNKEYYHKTIKQNDKSKNSRNSKNIDNEDDSLMNNCYSEQKIKSRKYIRNSYYNNFSRNKNFISRTIRSKSNNSSKSIIQDFMNRQDEFNKNKNIKKEKLRLKNEEEYILLCPFSPKIQGKNYNKNNSKESIDVYQKLYDDYNKRKKKEIKKINNYSNKPIKSDSSISVKNNNSNARKIINQSKIEKLYNDYKQIQYKKKELENKINLEEGITFKPFIVQKPLYKKKKI